jgi:carboxyl-terminal processing protease
MLASLDPYTVYFNEQDVLRFAPNNWRIHWYRSINFSKGGQFVREVYKISLRIKLDLKPGDLITKIGDVPITDFQR